MSCNSCVNSRQFYKPWLSLIRVYIKFFIIIIIIIIIILLRATTSNNEYSQPYQSYSHCYNIYVANKKGCYNKICLKLTLIYTYTDKYKIMKHFEHVSLKNYV